MAKTKGDFERAISKLERQILILEAQERDLDSINKEIESDCSEEMNSVMRDQFLLRRANRRSERALSGIGDLLGALTATKRHLEREKEKADDGLFDSRGKDTKKDQGVDPFTEGSSDTPPAEKKPAEKKDKKAKTI